MRSLVSGKLHIRKRTLPQWLAVYIFLMPFFLAFFIEFLGLPSFLKYTIDVAWVAVFLILFFRKKIKLKRSLFPFFVLVVGWLCYTLVVYICRFQSPFYYLWGLRNNFRFFAAFFAFAILFTEDDGEVFFKFMDWMFWVNVIVSLVQFFLLGYEQDYLGGIFGVERGCNAYSIIFFSVVIARSLLRYMNGDEKAFSCFGKCGASLFLSALAELKVFFLFFVVIFAMAAVFTKFSFRKLVLLLAASIMFMFASSVLTEIFGENSMITVDRIFKMMTATNYATAKDIGRLTAIPFISNRVLTDLPGQLFGLGLGNCDTSSFAICNTPFYQAHSTWHYTWFSSAFLYLETGYIGLAGYLAFYILCFFCSMKVRKKDNSNALHCQISMIVSAICVALTFYNCSLRMEVGYIAFFALALPYMKNGRMPGLQNR